MEYGVGPFFGVAVDRYFDSADLGSFWQVGFLCNNVIGSCDFKKDGECPAWCLADQPGFEEGAFIVQDPATAGAVELLDVSTGKMPVVPVSVLDFCAAPGGKTVQIAWRMGEGRACRDLIVAQEVNPKRLARLKENLARMKLDNVTAVQKVEDGALFDRVLVDAPCSNTGVIRRRPDARWRWNSDHLAQLVALQKEILEAAAAHVKPGGRLVYSTCSNEPEENAEQIAAFLVAHPDFKEVGRYESVPFETSHDGAFACALVREGCACRDRTGSCSANTAAQGRENLV